MLPGRLEEEAEFGVAGAAESAQAKRNREAIETLMRTSEVLLEELPAERRDTPQPPPPGVDDPAAAAIEAAEAEPGPRELSIRLHRLLAQLLPFHLRERKVEWWAFFDRLEQNPDERFADAEVIAAATLESIEEKETPRATHKELTYRFDTEQPLKLRNTTGNLLRLYLPDEEVSLAAQVDDDEGTVVLKLTGKVERERAEAGRPISVPARTDLVLFPPDISQHLRHHLARQARSWVDDRRAPVGGDAASARAPGDAGAGADQRTHPPGPRQHALRSGGVPGHGRRCGTGVAGPPGHRQDHGHRGGDRAAGGPGPEDCRELQQPSGDQSPAASLPGGDGEQRQQGQGGEVHRQLVSAR